MRKALWMGAVTVGFAAALVFGSASTALACGGCPGEDQESEAATKYGKVTIAQLEHMMQDGKNVHVYDVNSKRRYERGHIPGAQWASFRSMTAGDLPADKAATLVFYCANPRCHASHKAAKRAVELGYTNVFILPAGIQGWEAAGKPTERAKASGKAASSPTHDS